MCRESFRFTFTATATVDVHGSDPDPRVIHTPVEAVYERLEEGLRLRSLGFRAHSVV